MTSVDLPGPRRVWLLLIPIALILGLEACRESGIYIPTLCHDDQLKPLGSCQICIVEVQGYGLVASCATRIADGRMGTVFTI
ncbi:MAG: 2Fe-2S iron-sulfur cluster-binding protein [Deltaproteobacteria bacterium]|nr:2Fe-2S iron-sulfur cluster-binding protein [Deltaproteobacteria bacterium]